MSLSKNYPYRHNAHVSMEDGADYPEWWLRIFMDEVAECKPGKSPKTMFGAAAWVCSFCDKTFRFSESAVEGHWIDVSKSWHHFSENHPEVLTVLRLKISAEKS